MLLLAKLLLHHLMSDKPETDLLQAGVEREFKQKYMAGLGGGAAIGAAARGADAGAAPQHPHTPQLSAAYPASGPLQGGTVVSVRGARFGQAVSRGEITLALQLPSERHATLVHATFVSDCKLRCRLPPSAHPGVARLSLHLPEAVRPRAAAAPLSPAASSLDGGGGDAIEFRYYQVDQVRVRVRVRVG